MSSQCTCARTPTKFSTQASELAPLMNMWSDGRPSADLAYWLIAGLLAEGHYREADPYLRQAIERFSGEARFHNLAAIQAYKFSHLATAEVELRRALNLGDDVSHVLNLARILEEEGRLTEAQELLDQLVERHSNAPVAFLARDRSQYRSNP
jgi:tetratricopeptide (TPR) repeat protein